MILQGILGITPHVFHSVLLHALVVVVVVLLCVISCFYCLFSVVMLIYLNDCFLRLSIESHWTHLLLARVLGMAIRITQAATKGWFFISSVKTVGSWCCCLIFAIQFYHLVNKPNIKVVGYKTDCIKINVSLIDSFLENQPIVAEFASCLLVWILKYFLYLIYILVCIMFIFRPPDLGRKMIVKEDRRAVKVSVWMVCYLYFLLPKCRFSLGMFFVNGANL